MSLFLWPFKILWSLLTFILGLTGRILLGAIGLVVMIVGVFLTVTVVAAPVGIPLIIIGLLLVVRGIF